MLKKIVLLFVALALAKAQIPSLGWCPEYVPMANFDMGKFLGVWHEAERYFQITELASRCVTSNYTRGPDGKLRVYNEVINRITGVKRVVEGEIKAPASKSEEGKLSVKYTTAPLTPETQYQVLDSDYVNYAVLWGCSSIGPLRAENAWLMTRERVPSGEVLEMAYGVLDKYKISKRFFVKSDQSECSHDLPVPVATATPAAAATQPPSPAVAPASASQSIPVKEEPAVPVATAPTKKSVEQVNLRSAAFLEDAEPVDESRKENVEAEAAEDSFESKPVADEGLPAEGLRAETGVLIEEAKPEEVSPPKEVASKPIAPETIPEVILKVAESTKTEAAEPVPATAEEPIPVAEESKIVEVVAPAESEPEIIADPKPSEKVEDKPDAETVLPGAEKPKSDEPAPESLPVEEPSSIQLESAKQSQPADTPIETVDEQKQESDETKPLDAIPALRSPVVSTAVKAEEEAIESVAAPAKKDEKIPEVEKIVKAPEVPKAAEEPAAAETEKVSEPVEQSLKNLETAPLPETISESIIVPETLENHSAAEPLKSVEIPAEESKPEVKAESTPELKP